MVYNVELYGFSSAESPEKVKQFLEELTGEGTVCSVEVDQLRPDSRARAKVRFADAGSATKIVSLAKNKDRLWFGDSWLKAKDLDAPRRSETLVCSLGEEVILHFGYRASDEKFSVLWTSESVRVEIRPGARKLNLFLSYESAEYKLELGFDTISRTELHSCPHGNSSAKFLVLQLFGGPKIYRRKCPDTFWARDIDFTPRSSIGLSSSVCLEIPFDGELPNLSDTFVYYREDNGRFRSEKKEPSSFFSTSSLFPMVVPPKGVNLPYKLLFKLNSLVQQGKILIEAFDDEKLFEMLDPARVEPAFVESALDRLFHLKHCCHDPLRFLENQYRSYTEAGRIPDSPSVSLEKGLVYVHRVQLTPTRANFCGPEISLSNRILRNYPDDLENFLRVSFVDDDFNRLHASALSSSAGDRKVKTRVYERLLSVMADGITIGEKRFEFLAFSSSQLREGSFWMFASREGLRAEDIRAWMGDFRQIKNVAKYAARLGQSFSSSRETLRVESHELDLIPDVVTGSYCFSDGIGKISGDFAAEVAAKCGLCRFMPSAFQIRYAGFKGVVAVDPTGTGAKMSLRGSMRKYSSKNTSVDVLAWSRAQPCYLNRQVITLLSTLGVKDKVFMKKQDEAVERLDSIMTDRIRAREELDSMFPGEVKEVLKEMLAWGYEPNGEPFLRAMLRTLRASKLAEIRTKSRIYVEQGRALMGCMDETGTLEYGEVFVQCSRFGNDNGNKHVVQGNVVVAKNPCLHPGDLRVLSAVDVPDLHHMVDCVVFPQKGKRPHPNECSGSDLDGDVYFVSWDRNLVPPRQVKAMDYTPARTIELDHDVTIEEVKKYFVDYILDENLGKISNAHTAHADRLPEKALSRKCIELARLSSIAVDFPKTGVPANVPSHLHARVYPDFMENPHKPSYESTSVLGELYRKVRNVLADEERSYPIAPFTLEAAFDYYDPEMEVDGFEDFVAEASVRKSEYDRKLGNLMEFYGFETEAEFLIGDVVGGSRRFDKRRDLESASLASKSLIREARTWFGDGDDLCTKKRASAWYYVTYHPSHWGRYNEGLSRPHFLSFAWCVFEKLAVIKRTEI